MAARRSGGTATRLREKNQRLAQAMKQHGVQRSTMNCPLCHSRIGITSLIGHLSACRGSKH